MEFGLCEMETSAKLLLEGNAVPTFGSSGQIYWLQPELLYILI